MCCANWSLLCLTSGLFTTLHICMIMTCSNMLGSVSTVIYYNVQFQCFLVLYLYVVLSIYYFSVFLALFGLTCVYLLYLTCVAYRVICIFSGGSQNHQGVMVISLFCNPLHRGTFPDQGYDPCPFPQGLTRIEVDVSGLHRLTPLDWQDLKERVRQLLVNAYNIYLPHIYHPKREIFRKACNQIKRQTSICIHYEVNLLHLNNGMNR